MLPTTLVALLLVLAACTTDGGATAEASASVAGSGDGQARVVMASIAYDPTELTVSAGTTVLFVNDDSVAHTVTQGTDGTADEGAAFDEEVAPGAWVEITLDEAGDVSVTCRFHPAMSMVVHVE
jgi:plastocyanin